jgi:hypothetical protein
VYRETPLPFLASFRPSEIPAYHVKGPIAHRGGVVATAHNGVLFVSHAAVDKELASHLKKVIEQAFAGIDVFVSSNPEDLPS